MLNVEKLQMWSLKISQRVNQNLWVSVSEFFHMLWFIDLQPFMQDNTFFPVQNVQVEMCLCARVHTIQSKCAQSE